MKRSPRLLTVDHFDRSRVRQVLAAVASAALLAACQGREPQPSEAHTTHADGGRSSSNTSPSVDATSVALGEVVTQLDDSCWVVFQDRDGAYWFGSDGRGVCRYDGKVITRFTTAHGLVNDRVRGIQQHAPSGHILISTLDGVSRFDGERLVTLPLEHADSPDAGWRLDASDVWIRGFSGPMGPCRYDGKTLHALQFTKSPQEDAWRLRYPNVPWNPYEIWCVYTDRRGHIWFGTATLGVCRFDGQTREWMYESHLSELPREALFGIRSIIEDRDGAFWICNTQFRFAMAPRDALKHTPGAIAYSRKPGIDVSSVGLTEPFFYFLSVTQDARGHLWMATYSGGVFEYDGAKLTHYPLKDAAGADITTFWISTDNHGELWLGTHEHGPQRFTGKTFERFRP
jgi:ligand-binding sensor domain-containing protein